jgi:hypothetical protein
MTYASAGLGQLPAPRVGAAAQRDPVLASASLVASKILLQATQKPLAIRQRFVANKLDAMRLGLSREVAASYRRLVASGKTHDQALFDAMRMAIADMNLSESLQSVREKVSRGITGAEAFNGLGQMSPNDRAAGCAVASTAGTVGGVVSVVPGYGTLIGAVVGIGSAIAGQAMDCGAETRQAQQQAAQAQANLMAAQQAAAQQAAARQAAASGSRTRMILIGGGALVAVVGIGYLLLG